MAAIPVRKPDDKPAATTAVYIIGDCSECGADPVLHLIRARKLTKIVLDRADVLSLQMGDIIAGYCTQCGQVIELGWHET